MSSSIRVITVTDGVARIDWDDRATTDDLRREVASALVEHVRVEALVGLEDREAQRSATWAGLLKEGVSRGLTLDGEVTDRVVYARVRDDRPVDHPEGFRSLLNSFLPRKRAISQMLVRVPRGRARASARSPACGGGRS